MAKHGEVLRVGRIARRLATVAGAALFFASICFVPPGWAAGPARADLTRLVVIGDSLSAGYQNSSLVVTHQGDGFASLIAEHAGAGLDLPLISEPGIPPELHVVDGVIERKSGFGWRIDPLTQAYNLAVPGANADDAVGHAADGFVGPLPAPSVLLPDYPGQVGDFFAALPGVVDINDPLQMAWLTNELLTELILGTPPLPFAVERTQVGMAEALAPTTVLVWLGSNDVLWSAITGGLLPATDPAAFQEAFEEVMARMAATGATVVAANVPDVTVIPFLTSFEEVAYALDSGYGVPPELTSALLGIGPGDYVTPDAQALIEAILGNPALGPLPDEVVLDAAEVAGIREITDAINGIIVETAKAHGAALVDVHSLLERIDANGMVVKGHRLTTTFGGGIFSLDGIHPTNTGQAILANAFIRALNRRGAGLSPVNVGAVMADDPMVGPDTGVPPMSLGHMSPKAIAAIRSVFSP